MLTSVEQKKILAYARELLKARHTQGPDPQLDLDVGLLEQKRGIFVTLKIQGRLRGCIGHILGHEMLKKSIPLMTCAAAFEDPRFPPLGLSELAFVRIHISLLTEPVLVTSYKDVRPGIDGIIVTHRWKKGVYLPEVATETGWDRKTFVESCAFEKAGLTQQELEEATIEVFQTEGFEEEDS